MNTFGGIDNVQFSRGAILVNHNNPNKGDYGFTLGNVINGRNMDISDQIFTHEYGHTLQGRRWGPLYFLMIAPSSLFSAAGERHIHIRRWYERQATHLGYHKYRREPDWPSEIYPFNKY